MGVSHAEQVKLDVMMVHQRASERNNLWLKTKMKELKQVLKERLWRVLEDEKAQTFLNKYFAFHCCPKAKKSSNLESDSFFTP